MVKIKNNKNDQICEPGDETSEKMGEIYRERDVKQRGRETKQGMMKVKQGGKMKQRSKKEWNR